ncbi:alpha/beta hydrolase family protein [Brevibacterium sanguinis]|uniref:Alpha/beta hydrolase family protein n=2 Tax=Brevibacterium TaxID=1696 RepID=A0A366IK32_9MICO|nr:MULTISPECIES: alpha/beta hydrolase fold domain-containing protein [Brevibacterium]RBP65022.1 alpha/beta hydrolase family protein [Brevibacterium sanguinis]RBP71285.1 alpha/beta hydrolase family protein [Brevibacterium celere]
MTSTDPALEEAAFARLAEAGAHIATDSRILRHDYGPHPDQFVEVHGDVAGASAVVVVVHGGYFRERTDLSHARPMAQALTESGAACVLIEYRRAGGRPHCLTDVTTALDFILGNLPAWGLDAAVPVTISGHSAGGCLILGWSSHLGKEGPPVRLRPLAPITDLLREVADGLADGAVLDYMGVRPEEDLAAYLEEDPRSRAVLIPERVDVLTLHGDADATVAIDFSRTFPAPLRILPGANHSDLVDPESAHFPTVVEALLG